MNIQPKVERDATLYARIKKANFDWLKAKADSTGYHAAEVLDMVLDQERATDGSVVVDAAARTTRTTTKKVKGARKSK